MANVGVEEDGGRAQLMLVGGIALAVVLVSLALVLNSVIYTENLDTRNQASDVEDATQFRGETYDAVAGGIVHVNDVYRAEDFTTLYHDRYRPLLANLSERIARSRAIGGVSSDVDDEFGYPGTQIVDDTESLLQTFSPKVGVAPAYWTVAKNVTFRRFRITPNKDSLTEVSLADVKGALRNEETVVFFIKFTDSRDRDWYVAVWRDSSNDMNVVTYNRTSDTFSQVCTSSATEVTLDFAHQRFDGSHCEAFEFTEQIDGKTTIEYWNGDLAAGTYRLVVDRSQESLRDVVNRANYGTQCTSETYYRPSDDASPYTAPAVYSTIVNVTDRSSSAEYDGEIYVEPAPVGTNSVAPTVTQFDANDDDATDGHFTVSWNTADPTNDPVTVTLTLYDTLGNVVDRKTGSASGTVDLTGTTATAQYSIEIIASDDDGNGRIVREVHSKDGDNSLCPP